MILPIVNGIEVELGNQKSCIYKHSKIDRRKKKLEYQDSWNFFTDVEKRIKIF